MIAVREADHVFLKNCKSTDMWWGNWWMDAQKGRSQCVKDTCTLVFAKHYVLQLRHEIIWVSGRKYSTDAIKWFSFDLYSHTDEREEIVN